MKRQPNMPEYAYLGLLGIRSRRGAYGFFISALILGLIFVLLPLLGYFWFIDFFFSMSVGVAFFGTAYWYYAAMRWVDKHGRWPS